jgi:glycosyltransferase involved in cell wall biosynthesis
VLNNGCDHMRRITPAYGAFEQMRLGGRRYFLLLGNLSRNKNMSVAIQALRRVPDVMLVIVGNLRAKVFTVGPNSGADRVFYAGRIDDDDVAGLLRNAAGFIFPSLYEGFGIPPLEAMVNECPVIASKIPSVEEVCGGAALYFDPHDPVALADAMQRILTEDEPQRDQRKARGARQAMTFTWEHSAGALIDFCRAELACRR